MLLTLTHFRILCFTALALFESNTLAHAQNIATDRTLSFGEGIVTDNSAPYSISLQADGDYVADPAIVLMTPPQPGLYKLTEMIPLTVITNVTITVNQQMLGPGQDFTIGDFDIEAPDESDIDGEAIIELGATITTSGNGAAYTDNANYEAEMTLNVFY